MTDSVAFYMQEQQTTARLTVTTAGCKGTYRCIDVHDSATGVRLALSASQARSLRKQLKLALKGERRKRPYLPSDPNLQYPGYVISLDVEGEV